MYLVTNKNLKTEPELFPSFLIDGLFTRAKTDRSIFVKPLEQGYEVQSETLWLEIKLMEFT